MLGLPLSVTWTLHAPGHRPHSQSYLIDFKPEGNSRYLGCSAGAYRYACWPCDASVYYDDSSSTTTAPRAHCDDRVCTPVENMFPPPTPLEALNFAGPVVVWYGKQQDRLLSRDDVDASTLRRIPLLYDIFSSREATVWVENITFAPNPESRIFVEHSSRSSSSSGPSFENSFAVFAQSLPEPGVKQWLVKTTTSVGAGHPIGVRIAATKPSPLQFSRHTLSLVTGYRYTCQPLARAVNQTVYVNEVEIWSPLGRGLHPTPPPRFKFELVYPSGGRVRHISAGRQESFGRFEFDVSFVGSLRYVIHLVLIVTATYVRVFVLI